MSQLFSGKEVSIDSRCLRSGDPVRVRMRDSEVLEISPETAVAHANVTMDQWGKPSWAFT